MSLTTTDRTRLRGLAGAARVAWIPVACAVVVAIASEHPHGRALALALLLPALALGVAAHWREIVAGERG